MNIRQRPPEGEAHPDHSVHHVCFTRRANGTSPAGRVHLATCADNGVLHTHHDVCQYCTREKTHQRYEQWTTVTAQIHQLIKWNYQVFIANRAQHIARRRLGVRRCEVIHSVVHGTAESLMDTIDHGMQTGVINDEQAVQIEDSDIILLGYRCGGEQTYVVCHVSVKIDVNDVNQAKESSVLLGNVTQKPVIPVVIGDTVCATSQQRADDEGVICVLIPE